MYKIRIQEQIFDKYPTFRRGIVIARDMDNHGGSEELEALSDHEISKAGERPFDLKKDPRTAVWRQAHQLFGSNPNKFPPAHCSLIKRVQKKGARIPFINKAVAIMNYNSIKSITPVGGDDILKAAGSLELRYADGDETFTPLGQPEISENPVEGEVIYCVKESKDVMCRRWNWRNGNNTIITEDSPHIVMNIDALGDHSDEIALETRDRVAEMLERFCNARTEVHLLSPDRMSLVFDI